AELHSPRATPSDSVVRSRWRRSGGRSWECRGRGRPVVAHRVGRSSVDDFKQLPAATTAATARPALPTPQGGVGRTVAVLELLALAPEPMRLSAIGVALGLHKSTVHRILVTLIALGYAEQDRETSCYRAHLRMWELAAALIAQHPLRRAASP